MFCDVCRFGLWFFGVFGPSTGLFFWVWVVGIGLLYLVVCGCGMILVGVFVLGLGDGSAGCLFEWLAVRFLTDLFSGFGGDYFGCWFWWCV